MQLVRSRDSSVNIVLGYWLDYWGSIPVTDNRFFSFLHKVETSSGAKISSYRMDIGGSFPRGKSDGAVKLTTHLHLSPRSRIVELYLHFHISLHGLVLN
jgi:hypothetical protein